jgi:hypothetical protein
MRPSFCGEPGLFSQPVTPELLALCRKDAARADARDRRHARPGGAAARPAAVRAVVAKDEVELEQFAMNQKSRVQLVRVLLRCSAISSGSRSSIFTRLLLASPCDFNSSSSFAWDGLSIAMLSPLNEKRH